MTITNRKKMAMFQSHNMWRSNISILISFIWIMCSYSPFSSKWKFCHNIWYFILYFIIQLFTTYLIYRILFLFTLNFRCLKLFWSLCFFSFIIFISLFLYLILWLYCILSYLRYLSTILIGVLHLWLS
jgi:hypothetical protein